MKVDVLITKSGEQVVIHGPNPGLGLTPAQIRSVVEQSHRLIQDPEWWNSETRRAEITLEV